MKKLTVVNSCYRGCPFFALDGGPGPIMYCSHPYWEDKGTYAGFGIITQDNSHNRVPDKCPLRNGEEVITVRLK
jgi:hypothetical protein